MIKPKVAVLKAEGTNFEEETAYAFHLAGGEPEILLMGEVLKNPKVLRKFQLLDFPGGFSYGDDLYSGKIWANELNAYIREAINSFIKRNGIIIGVCNGFQVLVRSGLLPGFGKPNQNIGLIINGKGKFECRWVKISSVKNRCVFLQDGFFTGMLPVEHGEGRFIVKNHAILSQLISNRQIVFHYMHSDVQPAKNYPDNPNGSADSIAGICDNTGQIMGMMPHPEHFILRQQHPNWRRGDTNVPFGLQIYKKAISFLTNN